MNGALAPTRPFPMTGRNMILGYTLAMSVFHHHRTSVAVPVRTSAFAHLQTFRTPDRQTKIRHCRSRATGADLNDERSANYACPRAFRLRIIRIRQDHGSNRTNSADAAGR